MIEAKNLTKIFKVPTEEKSIFGAKKIIFFFINSKINYTFEY